MKKLIFLAILAYGGSAYNIHAGDREERLRAFDQKAQEANQERPFVQINFAGRDSVLLKLKFPIQGEDLMAFETAQYNDFPLFRTPAGKQLKKMLQEEKAAILSSEEHFNKFMKIVRAATLAREATRELEAVEIRHDKNFNSDIKNAGESLTKEQRDLLTFRHFKAYAEEAMLFAAAYPIHSRHPLIFGATPVPYAIHILSHLTQRRPIPKKLAETKEQGEKTKESGHE